MFNLHGYLHNYIRDWSIPIRYVFCDLIRPTLGEFDSSLANALAYYPLFCFMIDSKCVIEQVQPFYQIAAVLPESLFYIEAKCEDKMKYQTNAAKQNVEHIA